MVVTVYFKALCSLLVLGLLHAPGHKYYNDTAKQGLAGFIQISNYTVTSKGLYFGILILLLLLSTSPISLFFYYVQRCLRDEGSTELLPFHWNFTFYISMPWNIKPLCLKKKNFGG